MIKTSAIFLLLFLMPRDDAEKHPPATRAPSPPASKAPRRAKPRSRRRHAAAATAH